MSGGEGLWTSRLEPLSNTIAHFSVTLENEAGVDLVSIQSSLLHNVNHVVLMLTSIFKQNLH